MIRLLLLFALLAPVRGGELDRLAFLSGCWSAQLGPVTIEEQWNRPAGGVMLGFSRTLKAGRAVFHEFMRIEQRDASIVYTPRIGAAATLVPFTLVRATDTEVVFENPSHDFPQRIIYRRTEGGLAARIEGSTNGKARGEDFPYRQVSCP